MKDNKIIIIITALFSYYESASHNFENASLLPEWNIFVKIHWYILLLGTRPHKMPNNPPFVHEF